MKHYISSPTSFDKRYKNLKANNYQIIPLASSGEHFQEPTSETGFELYETNLIHASTNSTQENNEQFSETTTELDLNYLRYLEIDDHHCIEASCSDYCDNNTECTLSQTSEGSVWIPSASKEDGNSKKRKALDSFLLTCGASPVKKTLTAKWRGCAERTKSYYYIIQTTKILNEVLNVLVPGQETDVLQAIMKRPNVRKSLKGLDNHAAAGAKSIASLQKIADLFGRLNKGTEWQDNICKLLTSSKQYRKLDYKCQSCSGMEKKHILRSVNQDTARKSVLENLKEDEIMDFADPQGGKSICDRKTSVVVALQPPKSDSKKKEPAVFKLPKITTVNNFSFKNGGVQVWRQFEIGHG
ncbi:unnamed protein product [Mytilus coruscus]|uniref:Uncharacterized protein n=1 Tax=Mytilus coruscus TaxID=42192 RepID=A0A6J8EC45_MYTCO|nr:unnamed protein product [Mytilus coruscus]